MVLYLSFLESMSPYSLEQITQVGNVGVLFNGISTLTSGTQHVLHLQACTMHYQCKMIPTLYHSINKLDAYTHVL